MRQFIQRHASAVIGTLSGFDRLRLRGTLRWLASEQGMMSFLWAARVKLMDFKDYAISVTEQVRQASEQVVRAAGRPIMYLRSSGIDKEEKARQIAERDGVTEGLICLMTCVEPCRSFEIHRNAQTKKLDLENVPRKCLHYYFYQIHPTLGLMHVRLQTWLPFTIQICINGRTWLSRQLDDEGIGYIKRENCFVNVEDFDRAQQLLDAQVRVRWDDLLNQTICQVHPAHEQIFADHPIPYYWSVDQSEWATDVMFRDPQILASLCKKLVHHGITTHSSADVIRFLGQKVPAHGRVHGRFLGQVVVDLKSRPEGARLKYQLDSNSLKMYDKQGSVLRVETTLNNMRQLKAYRKAEGDPRGQIKWRKMRKGVGDMARRAKVCQAANERYLDALAATQQTQPLHELTDKLCRRVRWRGRQFRALNLLSLEDVKLLQIVNRGQFMMTGFRNRDLRPLLFSDKRVSADQARRQSAKITRLLRLLRAHHLIQKVPKTHRYQVTKLGRTAITALLTARQADTEKLTELAA